MTGLEVFIQNNPQIIVLLTTWSLIWKGFALWRAAKNDHRYWFVGILVLNTLGTLPIVYLVLDRYDLLKKLTFKK